MEKEGIKENYLKHTAEMKKARELKEALKARSCKESTHVFYIFNLQQVFCLPISRQGLNYFTRGA